MIFYRNISFLQKLCRVRCFDADLVTLRDDNTRNVMALSPHISVADDAYLNVQRNDRRLLFRFIHVLETELTGGILSEKENYKECTISKCLVVPEKDY